MLINKNLKGPQGVSPRVMAPGGPAIETGSADWTSWRGPGDDGKSSITGIRTNWEGGLQKEWEIDWLCTGKETAAWSAPVIQGKHLIITGRSETEDIVFCLNARTGALIWQSGLPSSPGVSHGSGARATPAIDFDRVYSLNRAGDLSCLQLADGRVLWQQNLEDEGGKQILFGYCSSPLVYKDLVLVDAGGEAGTIAFNKYTGDIAWKCPTSTGAFTSLIKISIDDRDEILSFHQKGLSGIDPEDGTELWFTPVGSVVEKATTPAAWGEKIFVTGIVHGSQLIEVQNNQVTILWKNKALESHHSDPIVIGDYLYGYSGESSQNRGVFRCLDLPGGKIKWETKEVGWGTVIFVDSHLICMDIRGNLFLVKPDPEKFMKAGELGEPFGKIRGPVWTVPTAANDRLYIRYKQQLICFNLKA